MGENRENSGNAPKSPAGLGPVVSFGDVRFDARTGELLRDGSAAKLTPKAASVLAALLERAPELVTKEELFARVWDGKAVGDEALTTCIQEVRRALDDDARQPRYIETRHRRGYRLIAPLVPTGVVTQRTAALPAFAGKPSLAVLPFDNLSPDPEQAWFADGIVEDMTTALSRIGAFFVVARSSSFTFKGRNVQAQEVGRQLGVRYIVEGSVQRAGGKLRLTAQLIEAETGHHLWADRYDGDVRDVFDLQDRIVINVVGAIHPNVRAAEIERARLKRPDSLQAYDFVLRAYPGFWSLEDPGHAAAIALFHKALELDPGYAVAMALAAWGHGQRFARVMAVDPDSDRRQAVELANAALNLAPDDPGILTSAGQALLLAGGSNEDKDRCGLLFRKALTLDPGSQESWRRLGFLHISRSEPDEAIEAFGQALLLSPLDPMGTYSQFGIAEAHFIAGRTEQALRLHRQCLAERPRDSACRRWVCALLALTGDVGEAQRMARELLADMPHLTLERLARGNSLLESPHRERFLEGLRLAGFP